MTLPPVPYVNQVDNAPRKNECGLACVLMLSRWNGRGLTNTVTELSKKYDWPDDGTSPANLIQALRDQGLTPTIGAAAQLPRIILVQYDKLPKELRRNKNDIVLDAKGNRLLHWIVETEADAVTRTYHDPNHAGAAGANLKTTKLVLDLAEIAASSRVGIVERPPEIPTMTKIKVLVDVRVRTGMLVDDTTWTNFALKAGQTLDATVSNNWATYTDPRYAIYDRAGNRKDTLHSVMNYNGVQYLQVVDEPPPPQPSGFKLGVSVLHAHHLLEPAYQAGIRAFLIMDGAVAAVNFKRAHPDAVVMYRRFLPHGAGIPDPKLFSAEAGMGNGIVFVSPLNEGDNWGYDSPSQIESRARFDGALAQMCKAQGTIYAGGGFSMGTPDFTRPDICEAMKRFYAPLYNSGLMALNMHTYSPTMGWIYQPISTIISSADKDETLENDETVTMFVGRDKHPATLKTWSGKHGMSILADPIGRRIWFERRWEWLFDSCGFDPSPNLLGIYSDETGIDEGGVGGFPAHGAGDVEIERWGKEYCALQRLPLNGVASVIRGAAIFQAGDTGQWGGYEVSRNLAAIARANQ